MKDFKFNDTFEKKLGEEKAKFIENLKDQGRFTHEKCRKLNNSTNFEEFTTDGFLWHLSLECKNENNPNEYLADIKDREERGYIFWKKISKR